MTPPKDIDFECWFCGEGFERESVEDDSLLIPRRRAEGGPYFLTTCSGCQRQSRVERNRAGVYLAGPIPIVPFADSILATFDSDLRRDLLHKKEHQKRRKGRREWFFGQYEEELLASGVRPKRATRGPRAKPKPRKERRQRRPPPAAEPPPRPEPPPPPEPPPAAKPVDPPTAWEQLGLEPGADREAIVGAFRELAKRYHPDRFEALDAEFKALAHTRFIALKAAMDELLGAD
jgi:hypothetical protein